jgi:hypothetical protein
MAGIPTVAGTTVPLGSLRPGARRSERLAALRKLESGLREDGWVRVVLDAHIHELYSAASELMTDASLCSRYRRETLLDAGAAHLGLSYLAHGDEPLYDATASSQRVHSLNMHEPLTPAECDARLPPSCDDDERRLAYCYHAWASDESVEALLAAHNALRRDLVHLAALPLLQAFALLLGLEEDSLVVRCSGRRSDNTSLLRVLEYPVLERGGKRATVGGVPTAMWGVSEHTDFECFSLLHEQTPGLQVANPEGVWHMPASPAGGIPSRTSAETSSWVVIVGDMLERLSSGYFRATPHRVLPTPPSANEPRRSCVYFQGFDEEEVVQPVAPPLARRSCTGGFKQWDEDGQPSASPCVAWRVQPDRARLLDGAALTQREWTEHKESAAREQLRQASSQHEG